jgi:hypothetical protein
VKWEGVGTSEIRLSKGQNVKSIFRMIRMSKDQTIKNNTERKKITFDVLIFFDVIGNIRTSKVWVHFLAKDQIQIQIFDQLLDF